MIVNICGIPHKVIRKEDAFNVDTHFGMIDFSKAEIVLNDSLNKELADETICHEMIHGILVHLGYNDYAYNEQFVQALGNAIYQGFYIKNFGKDEGKNNEDSEDNI